MKLNAYETIELNFSLRVGVLFKFHFILYDMAHYYTKSFGRHFKIGLGGGWAGCPPRLFVVGQPAQQPSRLIIDRGEQHKASATVNID
jgi:hypothetical protein